MLYDFIMPLLSNSTNKYALAKTDAIAITPSVNSDKNTISKMIVNFKSILKGLGYDNINGTE
jgi:hypothetical protein